MAKTKTKTYTTSELAKLCGVSVASISVLIRKRSFKPVKTGEHNAKYFDEAVKDKIVAYYQEKGDVKTKSSSTSKDDVIAGLKELVAEQKHTIKLLERQLEIKDQQIERATTLADQAQKLDLIKTENKKAIGTDENVVEPEREEEKQQKKTFFDRLFGR